MSLSFGSLTWFFSSFFSIDSFTDSNRRRCSVLQWNPDVATQLVVASDEDNSPALRVMLGYMILCQVMGINYLRFDNLHWCFQPALGYAEHNDTVEGVCGAH